MKRPMVHFCLTAVLACVFTPGVSGCNQQFIEKGNKAKAALTRYEMRSLGTALQLYRLDTGRYPDTGQGLAALIRNPGDGVVPHGWKGPYLDAFKVPVDGWGNPMVYTFDGRRFEIVSLGADGKKGGGGLDSDISSFDF